MFNSNSKLFDQIFELKFTKKQLVQESKRCEATENSQKMKAKQAMEKSNIEGAKIYAQNAIRAKSEALNYLQLASRLDAVIARLERQSKMGLINKSLSGIVKNLSVALKNAPLDKIVVTMDTFEKQFENLDVQTAVMDEAMNKQVSLTTPPEQVDTLLQQIADENGLELKIGLPQVSRETVAPSAQAEANNEISARLAALRGR